MSLNVEKLREKLNFLNDPKAAKNSQRKDYWRPTKNETKTIRAFPYPHNDADEPFLEVWFHYNVGNENGFLCPKKMKNADCPACDFAWSLFKTDFELFKQIAPKQRFYATVVDREDEEQTPKFWSFGTTIYKQLLEHLIDPDYQEALDPKTGLDMDVTQTQPAGQSFPKTTFKFKRKESKLAKTDKKIKEILTSVKDFYELKPMPSADEIKAKLDRWLKDSDELTSDDSNEVVKGGNGVETSSSTTSESSEDDVDALFEEAYNKEVKAS